MSSWLIAVLLIVVLAAGGLLCKAGKIDSEPYIASALTSCLFGGVLMLAMMMDPTH